LPSEPAVTAALQDFIDNPNYYFNELAKQQNGFVPTEHYVTLIPSKLRVFGASQQDGIEFAKANKDKFPADFPITIKGCSIAFSGNIDVNDDGEMFGSFGFAPYEQLAHGQHMDDWYFEERAFTNIPQFRFVGDMSNGVDYRDDPTEYTTYSGTKITKAQIAQSVLAARGCLCSATGKHRDRSVYPGHYRMVFADTPIGWKPFFIKAVPETRVAKPGDQEMLRRAVLESELLLATRPSLKDKS